MRQNSMKEMHLYLQRQNAIHDNRYGYGRCSYLLDAEGAVWYNGMETKKTPEKNFFGKKCNGWCLSV